MAITSLVVLGMGGISFSQDLNLEFTPIVPHYYGNMMYVQPFPYYNPCVGCSPWMLNNSYPAGSRPNYMSAPTGRIGSPSNIPLMERMNKFDYYVIEEKEETEINITIQQPAPQVIIVPDPQPNRTEIQVIVEPPSNPIKETEESSSKDNDEEPATGDELYLDQVYERYYKNLE